MPKSMERKASIVKTVIKAETDCYILSKSEFCENVLNTFSLSSFEHIYEAHISEYLS